MTPTTPAEIDALCERLDSRALAIRSLKKPTIKSTYDVQLDMACSKTIRALYDRANEAEAALTAVLQREAETTKRYDDKLDAYDTTIETALARQSQSVYAVTRSTALLENSEDAIKTLKAERDAARAGAFDECVAIAELAFSRNKSPSQQVVLKSLLEAFRAAAQASAMKEGE